MCAEAGEGVSFGGDGGHVLHALPTVARTLRVEKRKNKKQNASLVVIAKNSQTQAFLTPPSKEQKQIHN